MTVPASPFSVLLPVYAGDSPAYLRRAFDSVTIEQTLRPTEIVLVQDGPVSTEMASLLDTVAAGSVVPVRRVEIPENCGLGLALERGLTECSHDVVARMDADDVCRPDRFALQIPLMDAGFDLVGSAIQEFTEEDDPGIVRVPPLTPEEIDKASRFVSPFNHPSVVYRASAVAAAGGYEHLPLMEDYWLFVRMLAAGAKASNVAEPLVLYRVGAGAYARRGGAELLRSELILQYRMRRSGYTTRLQFLRNVVTRGGYRLVPQGVRRLAYRRLIVSGPPA